MKILINDKQATGLYDSGANVSLINYRFWKNLKVHKNISGEKKIETIGGISKSLGMIMLPVKIFEIEKEFPFFIVRSESFKDDILLGLNAIKEFKLRQDENLKITQNRIVKQESSPKINIVEIVQGQTDENVKKILKKYNEIFATNKFDVGTVKDYEACVKLTQKKFISKKPYRCSFSDKVEIEKSINELLNAGLIEESSSPFAAPVTLAWKKEDGKKSRFCNDFRDINKIIVPESQPFPRIDDLTVRARNCKYFTKIDINSAFWSIPVRKKRDIKLLS